jgi:hypothetical protein
MSFFLMPGTWVLLPASPDWGLGQVQSAVGHRVTVNFEHAGKVLVNTAKATLQVLDDHEVDAYVLQQQETQQR